MGKHSKRDAFTYRSLKQQESLVCTSGEKAEPACVTKTNSKGTIHLDRTCVYTM